MANFSGRDGAASYDGDAIGELRVWSLDLDVELTEDTVKGDTIRTYKPDLPVGRFTLEAWLDHANPGQAGFIADVHARNETPKEVILTVATGKTFTFNALQVNYRTSSPEGNSLVALSLQGTLTSIPVVGWA
jgi:hypothetical protein